MNKFKETSNYEISKNKGRSCFINKKFDSKKQLLKGRSEKP